MVTGKASHQSGAATTDSATVVILLTMSIPPNKISEELVAAACGAAGVVEAEAVALYGRLFSTAATAVETAACSCTAANSVRAITESYRAGGTVTNPSATMAAVAVAPTWT
jgi:hypothetical protein